MFTAPRDLLADWAQYEVTTRRDRNLALRLATQRATTRLRRADGTGGADPGRAAASTPGVVDLLTRRQSRQPDLRDDLDDVFARYYATHPGSDGLEVYDE